MRSLAAVLFPGNYLKVREARDLLIDVKRLWEEHGGRECTERTGDDLKRALELHFAGKLADEEGGEGVGVGKYAEYAGKAFVKYLTDKFED